MAHELHVRAHSRSMKLATRRLSGIRGTEIEGDRGIKKDEKEDEREDKTLGD